MNDTNPLKDAARALGIAAALEARGTTLLERSVQIAQNLLSHDALEKERFTGVAFDAYLATQHALGDKPERKRPWPLYLVDKQILIRGGKTASTLTLGTWIEVIARSPANAPGPRRAGRLAGRLSRRTHRVEIQGESAPKEVFCIGTRGSDTVAYLWAKPDNDVALAVFSAPAHPLIALDEATRCADCDNPFDTIDIDSEEVTIDCPGLRVDLPVPPQRAAKSARGPRQQVRDRLNAPRRARTWTRRP